MNIIKITKPDATFKGQRGEWFALLRAHDGKTVAEFFAAAEGRKDKPQGWLRWLVKQSGAASIVEVTDKPAAVTKTPAAIKPAPTKAKSKK